MTEKTIPYAASDDRQWEAIEAIDESLIEFNHQIEKDKKYPFAFTKTDLATKYRRADLMAKRAMICSEIRARYKEYKEGHKVGHKV